MVIDFSKFDCKTRPTLVLRSLDGRAIQTLGYAFNVRAEIHYNETSQISFDYPAHVDGERVPGYEKLVGMRIVDMLGVGQFIITNPGIAESASKETKTVTAYSLEYEFTYKKITLTNGTYNFWNPVEPDDTILGIILEVMPSWSVGTVDESLVGKYRTYDVNNENCYNFIKGTLQDSYSCIFDFDTYQRKINVRDISEEVTAATRGVYISLDNLAKEIQIDEQTEEIFTCLDVNGADGVTIRNVNPMGTNKIYNLDYFMTPDNFSQEIIDKWINWRQGFTSRQQEYFNLTVENALLHMQLEAEKAAQLTLEGELKVIEQQQAVAVEAAAQGIPIDATTLSDYATKVSAKTDEITAKKTLVTEITTQLEESQQALAAINQACSWGVYGLTEDEQKLIDRYIKEDSIEESSFVTPVVDSFTADGDSYPDANCSIVITGATLTGTALPSGKMVYSALRGTADVTVNGEVKLSGPIIRGGFDCLNGSGVASLYLESGCVTVSGPLVIATDCVVDPEIGGDYQAGTTATISSGKADIYVTRQLTAYSQRAVEWDLFDYGQETLTRISSPSYTFTVDSGNFLAMDEFDAFRRQLSLGDKLYLNLGSNFGVLSPVLIGAAIDFESRKLELEFGDSFHLSDSAFRLADLLEQSVSMGHQVDLSKYSYNAFQNAGGTSGVQELMDAMKDLAKNGLFSSGEQAYTLDDSGIRLRKWADETHTAYDDNQVWMTNNSIVFTNDNWNSASMALGTFMDPELGEVRGLVAPNLVGTMLAGKNLVIESEKQDQGVAVFRVDANGAKLYNSQFDLINEYVVDGVAKTGQISLHPSVGLAAGSVTGENAFYNYDEAGNIVGIKSTNGDTLKTVKDIDADTKEPLANFWCDREGNVYLKGNVYATDGVFRGTVYAKDGEFTGTVNATDGKFEGIVQASDFLDATGTSMLSDGKFKGKYLDLYGLTVTKKDSEDVTFAVSDTGAVTINGAVTMGPGSSINWNDVNSDPTIQEATDAANSALDTAQSAQTTANGANAAAARAEGTANSAWSAAAVADNNLTLLANGQYKNGTFINGTSIYSPHLVGDKITLTDGNSYEVGAMTLGYGSTWAFDLTSNLSLRLSAGGGNAYISSSYGPFMMLGWDATVGQAICQLGGGPLVIPGGSIGPLSSRPAQGTFGQIYLAVS